MQKWKENMKENSIRVTVYPFQRSFLSIFGFTIQIFIIRRLQRERNWKVYKEKEEEIVCNRF